MSSMDAFEKFHCVRCKADFWLENGQRPSLCPVCGGEIQPGDIAARGSAELDVTIHDYKILWTEFRSQWKEYLRPHYYRDRFVRIKPYLLERVPQVVAILLIVWGARGWIIWSESARNAHQPRWIIAILGIEIAWMMLSGYRQGKITEQLLGEQVLVSPQEGGKPKDESQKGV